MIASVILVIWHPVRLLATIQVILTGLVAVAFIGVCAMAARLHKSHEPVQEPSQVISLVALWGTIVPWILFTIYHKITEEKAKKASKYVLPAGIVAIGIGILRIVGFLP